VPDLRSPQAGQHAIRTGVAALVPDDDGRRGWTLMVNGIPCSHLDLDDPLRLDFEYMRWIGELLDVAAPEHEPLHALHLGGAACTLARYLGATRPTSRQLVIELDPDLVELAREAFGVRSSGYLKIRVGDAREALAGLTQRYDVVIRDAFEGESVPSHLTTLGFLAEVRRVLAPGGIYLANLGDNSLLNRARSEAATIAACFREVALIAEPAQLKGRRNGNVVLVGSDAALPVGPLTRRLAGLAIRATLLDSVAVRAFAAAHRPVDDPPPSPKSASPEQPPAG
jgi:predicted O-methyltransferase YrrM